MSGPEQPGIRNGESSSTISASRVGERRNDVSRVRTSCAQRAPSDASFVGLEGPALSDASFAGVEGSGMFVSRDAAHSLHECGPRLLLLCKHTSPFSGDVVEAAAPFVWFFDPGTLDPSALFEPIEQGIEGIDVERELATGPCVEQLAELVTVPPPRVEQGEDEQLRGPPFSSRSRARVLIPVMNR